MSKFSDALADYNAKNGNSVDVLIDAELEVDTKPKKINTSITNATTNNIKHLSEGAATQMMVESTKNTLDLMKNEVLTKCQDNSIMGEPLDDFMFQHFLNRVDPIEYCENVLRGHLPLKQKRLHENQTALIRAVCNPNLKRVVGMMSRQCITKGSIIHTRDGKLLPIEEAIEYNTHLTIHNATVYEVITVNGAQVNGTSNHPIYTNRGWVNIEDLTLKDKIYCLKEFNKFGNGIDDTLVDFLGKTLISYVNNDYNILKHYISQHMFDIDNPNFFAKENIVEQYKNINMGLYNIPLVINNCTRKQVETLLHIIRQIYGKNIIVKNLHFAEFFRELLNKLGFDNAEVIQAVNGYSIKFNNIKNNNEELITEVDGEILKLQEIRSITKLKAKCDVYDITIPNKGWFICGGQKVHNSGKTESIASFGGFLIDNYPSMRVGVFTPRLQQAEVSIGRLSTFFQMNEDRLNNKIVKLTKDKIELDNNSFITAVSASDQSNIEGLTFDVIVLDEAQKVSNYTMSERITPMGGGTNAKIVKIGTPKTKNHFYESVEGKASKEWVVVKRDWTQTPQNWALEATYLPDPETGIIRPYSTFILNTAMPKSLKQEMFPNNPEVWTEGELSIEDFKTQYMLEFIDGAGKYLDSHQVELLTAGEYEWLDHGVIGERYVAGIDFAGSNPDGDATQISVLRITPNGIKQKVFAKEFRDCSYPQQMYAISELFGGANPRFEVKKIFADYTGCGAPIIQTLKEEFGLIQLEGIIFNQTEKYTRSGMNMKNYMYGKWIQELDNGRFQYPTKQKFLDSIAFSAGKDNLSYYIRMIGEWADLEFTATSAVNKKIEAPSGGGYHDDVCDADVLANFAIMHSQRSRMPRPTSGSFRRF